MYLQGGFLFVRRLDVFGLGTEFHFPAHRAIKPDHLTLRNTATHFRGKLHKKNGLKNL